MSDRSRRNPFEPLFDAQRQLAGQGRTALRQSIDVQTQAGRAGLAALRVQRSAQHRAMDAMRRGTDLSADGLLAAFPGASRWVEASRGLTHDQLDTLERLSEETWDVVEDTGEQSLEAYAAALEQYVGAMDAMATSGHGAAESATGTGASDR